MPYVLKPESRGSWFPDEQCTTLRPPLTAPNRSHLKYDPFCSLMIYVTHDRTRVFVGVGHPSDRIARPASTALAAGPHRPLASSAPAVVGIASCGLSH